MWKSETELDGVWLFERADGEILIVRNSTERQPEPDHLVLQPPAAKALTALLSAV